MSAKLGRLIMRNTYEVTVTVNGKPWRRVPNLTDAGAGDRVFTVVRTDGGKTVVQFGAGVHGARPPVGSKIAVGYRTGAGSGGNTMTVVLQRTATPPTDDQALWVAIRNRTKAISFEFRERRSR